MDTDAELPLSVAIQRKQASTKNGFTTFTLLIRNTTAERYFATRIHFRSPSHTGLAYYIGATFKPDAAKEFRIDVFDDDDEEVFFWVNGFPAPPEFKVTEVSLGNCKTY